MIYKLIVSTDKKDTGNNDGRALFIKETSTLQLFEQMKPNAPLNFEITLDCFYLLENGKLIDVLSVSSPNTTGLIVSEKVANIMRSAKLYNTELIPVEITDYPTKKKITGYYLCHCYSDLTPYFDYSKEIFIRKSVLGYVEEEYPPMTYFDLLELYKRYAGLLSIIRPKGKYNLNWFNYREYDMFKMGVFDKGIYLSEKLCNQLMESNIRGAYFVESPMWE